MTCKWLISMVSFCPLRIGLWDPFQTAFLWLINVSLVRNCLRTGMILQVLVVSNHFLKRGAWETSSSKRVANERKNAYEMKSWNGPKKKLPTPLRFNDDEWSHCSRKDPKKIAWNKSKYIHTYSLKILKNGGAFLLTVLFQGSMFFLTLVFQGPTISFRFIFSSKFFDTKLERNASGSEAPCQPTTRMSRWKLGSKVRISRL